MKPLNYDPEFVIVVIVWGMVIVLVSGILIFGALIAKGSSC